MSKKKSAKKNDKPYIHVVGIPACRDIKKFARNIEKAANECLAKDWTIAFHERPNGMLILAQESPPEDEERQMPTNPFEALLMGMRPLNPFGAFSQRTKELLGRFLETMTDKDNPEVFTKEIVAHAPRAVRGFSSAELAQAADECEKQAAAHTCNEPEGKCTVPQIYREIAKAVREHAKLQLQ